MGEWVSEWETEFISEWVGEWVNQKVSGWVYQWVDEWVDEWVLPGWALCWPQEGTATWLWWRWRGWWHLPSRSSDPKTKSSGSGVEGRFWTLHIPFRRSNGDEQPSMRPVGRYFRLLRAWNILQQFRQWDEQQIQEWGWVERPDWWYDLTGITTRMAAMRASCSEGFWYIKNTICKYKCDNMA